MPVLFCKFAICASPVFDNNPSSDDDWSSQYIAFKKEQETGTTKKVNSKFKTFN